jgi:tellurite resistance protein
LYGYRSCPDCGVAVQAARLAADGHACAAERYIAHQMLKAHAGLERFEHDLARWLQTPQGRFAAFHARRSAG